MKKPQSNWDLCSSVMARHVTVFMCAAKVGSFSLAAETLSVTQPSVSLSVKFLEDKLGFDLFERSTRPLRLTPEGSAVMELLQRYRMEFSELLQRIRSDNFIRPILRIGLIESIADFAAATLVKSLKPLCGQLRLKVATSEMLMAQVSNRELDAAIISSELYSGEYFDPEPIFSSPLVLMLPIDSPIEVIDSWSTLLRAGIPFIHHSKITADGIAIQRFADRFSLNFPYMLEADNNRAIFQMISAGLGWSFFQPWSLFESGPLTAVKILKAPVAMPSRKVQLVCPRLSDRTIRETIKKSLSSLVVQKSKTRLSPLAPWLCREIKIY